MRNRIYYFRANTRDVGKGSSHATVNGINGNNELTFTSINPLEAEGFHIPAEVVLCYDLVRAGIELKFTFSFSIRFRIDKKIRSKKYFRVMEINSLKVCSEANSEK